MTQAAINVYLISGFLGSGKTTFLNRILKRAPTDRKLMVLMNEFGDEGIDGVLIEDPELELMEISKGSIFCACAKGDFMKGLYRIATAIKPEILVIEASGAANPSDLATDLNNPVFKGVFLLRERFCLIDAENFVEQYEVFTAVERQVESTDRFIINKVDLSNKDTIERIKEVVRRHKPNAEFVETTYARVDFKGLFAEAQRVELEQSVTPDEGERLLSEAELDKLVEQALEDQAAQLEPADRLVSMTCRWLSGTLNDFRHVAENLPSDVIRAKGFVFENGRPYFYSHVGRSFELGPFEGRTLKNSTINRVVFIRREFETEDILQRFQDRGLNVLVSGSAGAGGQPIVC
ncbi:MAG: CobW family GTP-binding protein [Thermodesulfobacteriota bacterium]